MALVEPTEKHDEAKHSSPSLKRAHDILVISTLHHVVTQFIGGGGEA